MILINLLPHREAARKRRKEQFLVSVGITALVGGALAMLVQLWYQNQVSDQMARNALLEQETQKLVKQIADVAGLRAEIEALKARQNAVEDLQSDRNMPVHLLDELVAQTPEGVYLQLVKQEGQFVQLSGMAQSQERVSELLRNLSGRSQYLGRPELIEIISTLQSISAKEQRRVATFKVRAQLIRPGATKSDADQSLTKTPL